VIPVVCPYLAGICQALCSWGYMGFNSTVQLSWEGMLGVVRNGRTEKGGGMSDLGFATYRKKVSGNPVYDDELKTAPWEIEKRDFSRSDDQEVIEQSLNLIRNDHGMLVLASVDGSRYGNTILIKFDQETLSIDKPIDFDEKTISDFRIYFKDISNVWSFFEVKVISDCPYSLCTTYPENLYRLQRRLRHRTEVPVGTRTVFWVDDTIHNAGYVKDISTSGMMICTGSPEEKFDDHSTISDIAIALPQHKSSEKRDDQGRIVLPVINRGRIVRSFRDAETDHICHGIAFCDEDEVAIEGFINKIVGEEEGAP
jgi:hypothetical protein